MSRRMLIASKILIVIASLVVVAGTCSTDGGGSSGTITVPSSDGSPPELSLQVAATEAGGESAAVVNGGSIQRISLHTKTKGLNVAASAKDSQSGIQRVEIWVRVRTLLCKGDDCTPVGEDKGTEAPRFVDENSPIEPGKSGAVESSVMFEFVDLTKEIVQSPAPGGSSRLVSLEIYVKGGNHLNGISSTPIIEATYKGP